MLKNVRECARKSLTVPSEGAVTRRFAGTFLNNRPVMDCPWRFIYRSVMKKSNTVFSVQDFCDEHGISRNHLYTLWARGEGPVAMRVGRRRLITIEAAAAWRRRMEEAGSFGRDTQISDGGC